MNKLLLLSAATLLMVCSTQAQTDESYVKSNIRLISKEETSIKKEKKEAKKDLRILRGNDVSPYAYNQFKQDFGDMGRDHLIKAYKYIFKMAYSSF